MTERKIISRSEIRSDMSSKDYLPMSEDKYRKIVENVNTGILVAQDARLVFVNRGIANFLGYTVEEMLSHPNPFDFIYPDDMEMVFERHMRRLKGEDVPDVYQYRVITKAGHVKWVEVTCVQVMWEGAPATLNFFIDVSEQKKAQLALEQSEERYRSLVENTMDGYFIYDPSSYKFIFLNQRACELFGYSMMEGLETSIWEIITPKQHDIARARIETLMDKPDSRIDTVIYDVIRKDGSTFKAEVSTSSVIYEGRLAIQGTIRDITEKETLQNQLFEAQKLESIGTLAGGMAHDFNNLLMGIQSKTSLMMLHTEASHQNYKHMNDICGLVRRAADLTKHLLNFARGGKYEVRPINLNQLIQQSAYLFGEAKKEINIHTNFEKELWPVEADRGQIEQVLLNLYVNASDAMAAGGELYLQTQNLIVAENYNQSYKVAPGKYVKISITDTGTGIDKAIQPKIFDPFFTTKKSEGGTGLGLASVYGIIKNHAGFINVYSEGGLGATFNIYFPASEKAVIDIKKSIPHLVTGDETILLVDDEEYIIENSKELLEYLGYTVLVAANGKDAIEVYQNNRDTIHMVILDMVMPGMNGAQTFDRLRAINPHLKVLISSGYSLNEDIIQIINRGGNGFIQKPFDIYQLSAKVSEVLDVSAYASRREND